MLLREPRRALHARIAEALESQFADIAESQPELLARHCTDAGLIEKAASSGSMRADSAVEPTKSENITVTWRRSAVSSLRGAAGAAVATAIGASTALRLGNRAQHFPPITEKDTKLL